jgi:hypothetical protein
MNNVHTKLDIILDYLIKQNCPIVKLLQTGLTVEDINRFMIDIPISLPDEMFSLFTWRNGVNSEVENFVGATMLFPGSAFYDFSNAVNRYKEAVGYDKFWNASKFLIFDSPGGEMLLIECDPKSTHYGRIYLHDIGSPDFETLISIYDSLDSLLDTIIECYSENVFICNSITGVKTRDNEMAFREVEISKKYNPESLYWSLF